MITPRALPAMADTRELASVLRVDPEELVRRRRAGLPPRAVKIGTEFYYLRAHVETWLTAISAQLAG